MRGYYCIRNSRALGETTNEKQIKRKCDTKSSAIRRLHDATVLFWLRLSHIFGFARAHFLFIFKIDSFISSCQLFFKKKKKITKTIQSMKQAKSLTTNRKWWPNLSVAEITFLHAWLVFRAADCRHMTICALWMNESHAYAYVFASSKLF